MPIIRRQNDKTGRGAMRLWQVGGQGEPREVMRQAEGALGPIRPGELRIRVAASGIGLPDVLMCRGTYPLTPTLPFTPGQEFVGTVIETGAGVATPVGTRLMGVAAFTIGRGSFADECITYEAMTYPVGAAMDDPTAACFTIAYHTAYLALVRRAKLCTGETVLVHGGAGGTGMAAIQLAHALGATVIATAGSAEKAEICRAMGADFAVVSTAQDFVSFVDKTTGGSGADIVFDPVGGTFFERSVDCIAREGRLLPIGFASGRWGVVGVETLAFRNISIVGALGGGFERDEMLAVHETLLALHAAGRIAVRIDRQIDFSEIADGVQRVADRLVHGRVVAVN
jgi:NADPH2:quinone reductase